MRPVLLTVLLLLVFLLTFGCQTPGQYRAGVKAMSKAAHAAYDLADEAWKRDLIDTPTHQRAAVLYDRYFDAANALLDLILEWEASPFPQPRTPAEVLRAHRRATALLLSLEALAAEIRRARDSPAPVDPPPPVTPSAAITDQKRSPLCTSRRAA